MHVEECNSEDRLERPAGNGPGLWPGSWRCSQTLEIPHLLGLQEPGSQQRALLLARAGSLVHVLYVFLFGIGSRSRVHSSLSFLLYSFTF